jgi:4-amino-4-deoxychorismate lyase
MAERPGLAPGIVVGLDGDVIAPGAPVLCADDPMVTRSDGVFETLLVRGGRPCLLSAHLDRLANSAAITGLPVPDLARWRVAAAASLARWEGGDEAVMRFLYGRGRADAGVSTSFVTVSAVPVRVAAARRDGVSVITLDRGVRADSATGQWSLAGAKSLSYAANSAALRHAARMGADDVVFVSSDGFVLEGPRSTVVVAPEIGTLLTPPASMPILPGTTQRAVFDAASGRGWKCAHRPIRVADLFTAQGIWLLSSVTLAARVHTVDGVGLHPSPIAGEFASLVDAAVAAD